MQNSAEKEKHCKCLNKLYFRENALNVCVYFLSDKCSMTSSALVRVSRSYSIYEVTSDSNKGV